MEIEQMRIELKESGVKQAMNMKEETIVKKHSEMVNPPKKPSIQIDITKENQSFFDSVGFKAEWLASLANQYDFTRFHYVHKFKAFRCYRGDNHVDWISLNDLGLTHEKKEITEILLKHQPLQKNKQIIKLPWR